MLNDVSPYVVGNVGFNGADNVKTTLSGVRLLDGGSVVRLSAGASAQETKPEPTSRAASPDASRSRGDRAYGSRSASVSTAFGSRALTVSTLTLRVAVPVKRSRKGPRVLLHLPQEDRR